MGIFKIGRIGTKEVTIEEAEDVRAACYKAGWAPEWCEVTKITDQIIVMNEDGETKGIDNRTARGSPSSVDTRLQGYPHAHPLTWQARNSFRLIDSIRTELSSSKQIAGPSFRP